MSEPTMNVCQNCRQRWRDDQLKEITHGFWERVAPGEVCPSGECADCGALCHPEKREERRDMSQAGMLRRAAYRFEQRGQTATGILLSNAAWILEHPNAKLDSFGVPDQTPRRRQS